jgi:hypothetical protein
MKKIVALTALVALACTANAHCGRCEGDAKPKVECKKCKGCGDDCKSKCHKSDATDTADH